MSENMEKTIIKIFINKIIKFILNLKKEHKFLFLVTIISFILSAIPCLYCLIILFEKKYASFIFFIPFLAVILTDIFATYVHKYIPKLTNFITFVTNSFIVIIIQIFFGIFILSFISLSNDEYMVDKPEFYEKVLAYFPEERVAHFPKHIPEDATNIEMDADLFSFFGSQGFIIKFDTNENYINNELKKYQFKSKETPYHYVFGTLSNNIDISDFTFYVISGTLDRFGRNYGIGVNKNFNKIIYYYSNPD